MEHQNNKYLLVLAGPTASGKTKLAIQIARYFQTEIISADSRQFYRELRIGTATPSESELAQVKHYFVANKSIKDHFDVAMYEKDVLTLLSQLFKIHDVVILTGGSGLFIDAVCNGLDALPETSDQIRIQVQQILDFEGIKGLQERVHKLDPDYYKEVDIQNPRRLQRALEVCLQTGATFSSFRTKNQTSRPFQIIKIAIETNRNELIARINQRVDLMIETGLVDEVISLKAFIEFNALNTVGYKEIFQYLSGEYTLEVAIEKIKTNTRRYAKRQITWLRKTDEYHWFERDEIDKIIKYCRTNMA